MIKRLTKHGDGLALIIDGAMLERLGIDDTTTLSITAEDGRLVITPVDDERAQQLQSSLLKINETYHGALKKLAE